MVPKIYLVICQRCNDDNECEERTVCAYTDEEMAHLHVQLLEKYMDDAPKLTTTPSSPIWYERGRPYSPVWLEWVRQREEYIQACPYDVRLRLESWRHDQVPWYSVSIEDILVRHPDEYLENAAEVTLA